MRGAESSGALSDDESDQLLLDRKFDTHARAQPTRKTHKTLRNSPTLQGVTAASSGTHTHAGEKEQTSSLALFRAPVCGMRRLPEGSRKDTGGVSVMQRGRAQSRRVRGVMVSTT